MIFAITAARAGSKGSAAPRSASLLRSCIALWILTTLLSCTPDKELPPPNLFLILIDTLRFDRVGPSGNDSSLTPFLDSIADSSYVFKHAYSTSSWTNPAVASLFTSRYPSQHRVLEYDSVLPATEITLAELLTECGYITGGFSANPLIGRIQGFGQGFDVLHSQGSVEIRGRKLSERTFETGRRALRWIDGLRDTPQTPIFLYLHVIDPHSPYAPDTKALRRVLGDGEWPDMDRVNTVMKTHLSNPIDEETRSDVLKLYDAEVSSMDASMKRFFAELDRRGLLDSSMIIVVADHGEEFWEHGAFGHHNSLHEEVLRVPVLIHMPGQTKRYDVAEGISLLDIAPTIVDWLGHPPVERFEGRSLTSLMSRQSDGWFASATRSESDSQVDSTGVIAELILSPSFRDHASHERTIIFDSKQLIRNFDGSEHFLNLSRDSRRQAGGGISDVEKESMRKALDRFIARMAEDTVETEPEVSTFLDEERIEQLRVLGYVE